MTTVEAFWLGFASAYAFSAFVLVVMVLVSRVADYSDIDDWGAGHP